MRSRQTRDRKTQTDWHLGSWLDSQFEFGISWRVAASLAHGRNSRCQRNHSEHFGTQNTPKAKRYHGETATKNLASQCGTPRSCAIKATVHAAACTIRSMPKKTHVVLQVFASDTLPSNSTTDILDVYLSQKGCRPLPRVRSNDPSALLFPTDPPHYPTSLNSSFRHHTPLRCSPLLICPPSHAHATQHHLTIPPSHAIHRTTSASPPHMRAPLRAKALVLEPLNHNVGMDMWSKIAPCAILDRRFPLQNSRHRLESPAWHVQQ